MRIARCLTAALAVAFAGCTLEPNYERPAVPAVPDAWPQGPAYDKLPPKGEGVVDASDIGWREFFTDPLMQAIIEETLEHNPDVRIAAFNVAAAQAQYRIQRADLFPSIDATALEQVQKFPSGVVTSGLGSSGTTARPGITRFYDVGIGFTSYEIDLFGRIRSLDHERLEQYFAYAETRRATRITLVSEIANVYLSLLADEALLKLTQDTLANQQAAYDLTQQSFDGGVASELDLRQAEIALDTARANLAQYTRQVAQDLNGFVLVGAPLPKDLPPGMSFEDYRFVADLTPGLPSQVLLRRPDVLSAEHNLIAANADIGAARAAFFPSITLTGSYGSASRQLTGLFDKGSTAWTFSPQISVPIFAGGANVAGLDLSKIEKNVQVATYEKTVETAFREVADALAARGTLDEQLAADQALADASRKAYELAGLRFENGVDSYLSVLDAQRTLYSAQQTLISIKLARLQNQVTLYKALGGGWREHSETAAAQAPPP